MPLIVIDTDWNMINKAFSKLSGRRHYILRKAWQRSIRNKFKKSRCRHAETLLRKGYRYKGGR
nr:MAG TPA: hypothetical protein [Caudoviricetes sp.]